jgi:hypothetical protein
MVINNMTYQNGKIYCIRNTIDDDIYVGSTTQPLCKRMVHHRSKMKMGSSYKLHLKMADVGLDKFYIELIENCPCENKEELRKREGFFIREMGTLNSYIAGRTTKDWFIENQESALNYRTIYFETHKNTLCKKQHEYRESHKEQLKEAKTRYCLEHKTIIQQKRSTIIICECGRQITHSHKSDHLKSKKHQQLMNELSLNSSETLND